MLLFEVIPTRSKVYHLTSLHSAAKIIADRQFQLKTDETGMYRFSVARSPQSAFIDVMGGEGSVILVLDRGRLAANASIRPYSDKEAEAELSFFSSSGDEMEDRVYSKKPILPIRGPVNQTILQVRLMGGTTYEGGNNAYSKQQYAQFMHLCQANNIQVITFNKTQERQFRHG